MQGLSFETISQLPADTINALFDFALSQANNAIIAGGYDPAILPEKSTSFKKGFIRVSAKLKDGTVEGLSDITRIGDVNVDETSGKSGYQFSGKLGISQSKATYTASVSGGKLISKSVNAVAFIDNVGMSYEIETCDDCPMTLTKLKITVGKIDVNIKGLGVLGKHLGKVTSLASNEIKGYIISTYKEEVANEIQKTLDDIGPLSLSTFLLTG